MKDSFSEADNFIEIVIQKQKEQLSAELNRIDAQMMRSVTRVQKSEMAYELHGLLAGNVSIVTGENIKPSYVGDDEAFLRKVITPIYRVVEKEASTNATGKAAHSDWSNYDDLNEYFWYVKTQREKRVFQKSEKHIQINFTETRTFWHIYHSFDRLWTFYLLALQTVHLWDTTSSYGDELSRNPNWFLLVPIV
ncbi:unnamed protein product [Eruca vesicaria subsp. sativa]|uniref:1,3-beta-glucan synthase component FKS1-like domain-containing protein n=1 Tax=Eruca vesicaria subsp. sativa TaxID=29727 RepID=A0ABC8JEL7_ERUVS|nr:unnamed protein product [Eruca vesicaria subsp. sativa]